MMIIFIQKRHFQILITITTSRDSSRYFLILSNALRNNKKKNRNLTVKKEGNLARILVLDIEMEVE